MKRNQEPDQKKNQEKNTENYDQIAMYLTEVGLLTQAERVRFLELVEEGACAPCGR